MLDIVSVSKDQLPPKIASTFNSEYYFPMLSILTDAKIECNAKNGKIEYEWKKDGVIVQNSKYVSVDKDTGTLKFNQMQGSDYGTYQCFAKNDFGTSLSEPFDVKVSAMGAFPSKEPEEIQCKEFEHCKIPCRDKPECSPESECRVEWKIGEGTKTNVELSKRVGVDGNGDLHFIWTNNTDWTGLNYKCGVWQEQLKMLVVGSITTLRIFNASLDPNLDPIVVYRSHGKAQYRGEGVLKCMFSGYATPDIEWVSPDNAVIKNSAKYVISDYDRGLTIKDAMPDDEGLYACRGKGINKTNTQHVFLNVTSAPMLDSDSKNPQMNDLLVSVGKNATFYCQAVSLPGEEVPSPPKWMKNGVALPIDEDKYILSPDHNTLTINVQKDSDTGVYQCMSENSEGVLFKEAFLKVIQYRPETTSIVGDNNPSTGDFFHSYDTERLKFTMESDIVSTRIDLKLYINPPVLGLSGIPGFRENPATGRRIPHKKPILPENRQKSDAITSCSGIPYTTPDIKSRSLTTTSSKLYVKNINASKK
ncbi:contactin-4-like [Saccostrea echinata]|uniref:contactin-4-like n=1 Tax=Saccostrea echinata TaxID=191078 RepID=UPI002A8189DD|nr:contactin-4-like [Saccostrea echinata]